MSASHEDPSESKLATVRRAVASAAAGVLGAAPHVLHHVGPIAGAALLAGTAGKLLFLVIGFALMLPMVMKMRRHSGSWRAPLIALALFSAVFAFSTFVVGPLVAGDDDTPTAEEHEVHHP